MRVEASLVMLLVRGENKWKEKKKRQTRRDHCLYCGLPFRLLGNKRVIMSYEVSLIVVGVQKTGGFAVWKIGLV